MADVPCGRYSGYVGTLRPGQEWSVAEYDQSGAPDLYYLEDDVQNMSQRPHTQRLVLRQDDCRHNQQRVTRDGHFSRECVVVRTPNLAEYLFLDGDLLSTRIEDLDRNDWWRVFTRAIHATLFTR